jgi:hypothetical protein
MPAKTEPDHELTRATTILLAEIRAEAPRYATKLFPGGPAGHTELKKDAELELIRHHWDEPGFRKKLLDRLSPPGPNGLPGNPEGVDRFLKLYTEAVAIPGPEAPQPMSEERAADQPDVGGFGPGQQRRLERAFQREQAPPPTAPALPGATQPPAVPGAAVLPAAAALAPSPVAPMVPVSPEPVPPSAPPTGGGALPALALLPAGMPPPPPLPRR